MKIISKEEFNSYTFNDLEKLILWIISNILYFQEVDIIINDIHLKVDIEIQIYREPCKTRIVQFMLQFRKPSEEYLKELFVFAYKEDNTKYFTAISTSYWCEDETEYYNYAPECRTSHEFTDSIHVEDRLKDIEEEIKIPILEVFNAIIKSINDNKGE